MQKTITLIFLFLAALQQTSAANLYVNPSVIPNTIPNTYATIPAAIYAAVDGDQIFIKPGTYNAGITSGKSISIAPDTADGIIILNGSINLNGGSSNYKAKLLGIQCLNITINAWPGKLTVIDCKIANDLNVFTSIKVNIFRSEIGGNTKFQFGSFINSKTNNLFIDNGLPSTDTTNNLIIADTITGYIDYRAPAVRCIIANNLINELNVYAWYQNITRQNLIWNNEFYNNSKFLVACFNVDAYNFDISNNVFSGINIMPIGASATPTTCQCANAAYRVLGYNNINYHNTTWYDCNYSLPYIGTIYCSFTVSNINFGDPSNCSFFPNSGVPGVLIWTYNGVALGIGIGGGPYPITNIAGTTNIIDAGNPDPKYMDIDMTVNDRGRLGGPYSILNYNPTLNPSNGKAYIYDIELPEVISSPTQPIQIKASGYHRN